MLGGGCDAKDRSLLTTLGMETRGLRQGKKYKVDQLIVTGYRTGSSKPSSPGL